MVRTDHNRQRRRYKPFLDQLLPPAVGADVADEFADAAERDAEATALRAAFSRLKPQDRYVLTLCVVEGLSLRQAASALAVAEGTVNQDCTAPRQGLARCTGNWTRTTL